MKRRFFFFVLLISGLLMATEPVSGNVEPNQYKEKDVKIKTDVFHDGNIQETRKALPELQGELTFTGIYKNRHNELKEGLFLQRKIENNSIISKTSQLGLFADGEGKHRQQTQGAGTQAQSDIWSFQLVLFILITFTLLALFLLLIPKIAGVQSEKN